MEGFEQYTEEMIAFEASNLFPHTYHRFLDLIGKTQTTSAELELRLGVAGACIRSMAKHARRNGVWVASDSDGYFIARSAGQLDTTLQHLEKRWKSIYFTYKTLKESIAEKTGTEIQQELAL